MFESLCFTYNTTNMPMSIDCRLNNFVEVAE